MLIKVDYNNEDVYSYYSMFYLNCILWGGNGKKCWYYRG